MQLCWLLSQPQVLSGNGVGASCLDPGAQAQGVMSSPLDAAGSHSFAAQVTGTVLRLSGCVSLQEGARQATIPVSESVRWLSLFLSLSLFAVQSPPPSMFFLSTSF